MNMKHPPIKQAVEINGRHLPSLMQNICCARPSSKHPYKMVQAEPETYPSVFFSLPSGELSPTWPTRAATRLFCLLLELGSLALFLSVSPSLIPRCPILFMHPWLRNPQSGGIGMTQNARHIHHDVDHARPDETTATGGLCPSALCLYKVLI